MITNNLNLIREQIRKTAHEFARNFTDIKLLAVSKTHSAKIILQAYDAGQRHFGENYLQEALSKQRDLQDLPIVWHFIGKIQSNKCKQIAQYFDWVHTVDSLKIAEKLSKYRLSHQPPLKIFLQINISNEESKSGCSLQNVYQLTEQIRNLPNLDLCGLMVIPAVSDNFTKQLAVFNQVKKIADNLNLPELSMGMSNDMRAAIAAGSTWLRIGTAIFGVRK